MDLCQAEGGREGEFQLISPKGTTGGFFRVEMTAGLNDWKEGARSGNWGSQLESVERAEQRDHRGMRWGIDNRNQTEKLLWR